MIQFRLTIDRRKGVYDLVTRGCMPPFQDLPDVILWGDRVFKFAGVPAIDGDTVYVEAFAWPHAVHADTIEAVVAPKADH